MNLRFGERYEKLRQEVSAFCQESWPLRGPEAELGEREQAIAWRKHALAAGWLHRTVPEAYGGAGLEVRWAGPGIGAEVAIPDDALFR